MKQFTKSEIERAKAAKKLYHTIGNLSIDDYKTIIKSNAIKKCPVVIQDIENAETIYGKDVSSLKGKSVRTKPTPAIDDYVEVPSELKAANEYIDLFMDIMCINEVKFLVSTSKRMKYINIIYIKDRMKSTLLEAIDKVLWTSNKGGFVVNKVSADPEFEIIRDELEENDIALETAAAQVHVPEIERCIRVIKERYRAQFNRLPYRAINKPMVIFLSQECARWLNMFPPKGRVSSYHSPQAIVNGKIIDYNKHCKFEFGS